jgi:protein TonB
MFEQATVSYCPVGKRVWTTCLGITGQAVAVIGAVLFPMIWPDVLPKAQTFLVGPLTAPPPGVSVKPRGHQAPARRTSRLSYAVFREPAAIPNRVAILVEPEGPADSIAGIPNGLPPAGDGDVWNPLSAIGSAHVPPPRTIEHPPEPPQPPAAETAITRLHVSRLDAARLLHRVEPIYPPIAVQMRTAGTVELRGVIGVDGRIRELKVLRGHPLLIKAAVDAVSQWIYEPTRLNGKTVEVDAPILVTFHLH